MMTLITEHGPLDLCFVPTWFFVGSKSSTMAGSPVFLTPLATMAALNVPTPDGLVGDTVPDLA
jgi:hypothetical protein